MAPAAREEQPSGSQRCWRRGSAAEQGGQPAPDPATVRAGAGLEGAVAGGREVGQPQQSSGLVVASSWTHTGTLNHV